METIPHFYFDYFCNKKTLEKLHKESEPIVQPENHYLVLRNHLKDIKYHIEALKRLAPGSPTLAIKEMMYECGLKALER